MTDWENIELGNICEVVRGGSPRPIIDYITDEPDGVNWLKIGDVKETDKFFTHANEKIKPSGIPKTREVKAGDLILSNSMSFGRAFITLIDGYIHDGWLRLRCDESRLDKEYLYYFLTSNLAQNQFKAIATGSVVNNLKSDTVKAIKIDLPTLGEQKRIAEVLSMFDDKIKCNEEVNKNLEQQAQALYREMFVNTTNDQRRTCRAEEYFDIAIGKTPPRKEHQWFTTNPSDATWVSISDMGSCGTYIIRSSEQLTQEAVDKFNIKVVPSNTVLLSFKLTVGRIAITHGEMITNEAIAHFKTDKAFINEYLYCYLRDFNYQTMGSTSSIAIAVNSKIIKAMPFVIPADDEISRFHSVVGPMFEQILNNQLENDSLADLRDTLLPRLMSGEIDVSDIDP
ncbi:type I restriction modification DNA specificity domain protein [Mageeibacillus indolicus UPII9-5]|uniref:Type I restriction modification DNA specificity domain protein n=1 Tax=Mageeibacillus indolicus (strain UPII9-5) TaxID=699246 RepID=D3R0W6_MAGIU|nr:restriction endonuclease subunit S [Mageeibacillus indolicus]ADC91196.1 type I restriction modification DNA specificity domain protein [Mageeibacillus indolicus UPII9-5]